MSVPRLIHSLWLHGEADQPEVVRLCLERWARLNPDHELRVLDRAGVDELLDGEELPVGSLSPQALSDVVRAKLLLTQGGVWVDATVLPTLALEQWLPELVDATGFFAFAQPAPDRPLSSWFLACTPKHVVLDRWWSEIKGFWSVPRGQACGPGEPPPPDPAAAVAPGTAQTDSHPYFWLHYLFAYLMDRDADVARVWSECVKLSADAPHRLQVLFEAGQRPAPQDVQAAAKASPVHKLNWRVEYPLELLAGLPG